MPLRDDGDLTDHFLSAKERDVESLVREGEELLRLDSEQAAGMETFLTKAWFSGTHACHAQMLSQVRRREPDVGKLDVGPLEADFKALMDESADTLNLSVIETLGMWGLLSRACVAGIHSCRSEITALMLEARADIAEEALRWLERQNLGGEQLR
ncbi:MAG TPA: hypothetical protein VHI77_09305 [Solirubrobacterales bacterium]|nr:hypothetical protein [Solirubrobacterales bacterium]